MIKKIFIVLIPLFIIGCDNTVTSEMWENATEICKNNKGVSFIHLPANDEAYCNNGMSGYLYLGGEK